MAVVTQNRRRSLFFHGIRNNTLKLKLLALLIKQKVLMRTIVGGSKLLSYRPCSGGKPVRGINRTKGMIVSWQRRLKDGRMGANDVEERLLFLVRKVSIKAIQMQGGKVT